MRTPRPQIPEPIGKGGAVLLSTNQLALLHGLYDRPGCRAESTADMITAAIPYVALFHAHVTRSSIVKASRRLHPAWVARVRNRRWIACELTARGRAIVERTIPSRIRGLGDYAGLAPIRAQRAPELRAEVVEDRWRAVVRDPKHAALTAAAEALVVAWERLNPCVGMAANMGKQIRRQRLATFVKAHVLRHRALPVGTRCIGGGMDVDFDRLRVGGVAG